MVVPNATSVNRISSCSGILVWLAFLFVPSSGLYQSPIIEKIVLLAPLVVVPLGLSLAANGETKGWTLRLSRFALFTQPVGALLAVCSFFAPPGPLAATLAAGWFIVTGLIALCGLARVLEHEWRLEELCVDAGLMYVSVGGAWLIISRAGWQPMGFGDTIVLLTAVHFHYAGFAAPLLTGLTGRVLRDSTALTRRAFQTASLFVIAGPPLVATGIIFSPTVGLIGTIILTLSLLLLAALVLTRIVPACRARASQVLLSISAASSILTMTLACAYSYSVVARKLIISIPQMAATHGLANSVGFSLCGLLGWTLMKRVIVRER